MVAKAIHIIFSLGAGSGFFGMCPPTHEMEGREPAFILPCLNFCLPLVILFCPALLKPKLVVIKLMQTHICTLLVTT